MTGKGVEDALMYCPKSQGSRNKSCSATEGYKIRELQSHTDANQQIAYQIRLGQAANF